MNWVSIGPGNGLSPVRRQAITLTNAAVLSIEPSGTNFSEIRIAIRNISFMKMSLKMSFAKWRPFCPGGDELIPPVIVRKYAHSNGGLTKPSLKLGHGWVIIPPMFHMQVNNYPCPNSNACLAKLHQLKSPCSCLPCQWISWPLTFSTSRNDMIYKYVFIQIKHYSAWNIKLITHWNIKCLYILLWSIGVKSNKKPVFSFRFNSLPYIKHFTRDKTISLSLTTW